MRFLLTILLVAGIYTAYGQKIISVTRDTTVKPEAPKTVYDTVDVKPVFKGNLSQYLVQNIRMPKGAKAQGRIVTQFWIDAKGNVSHVQIMDKVARQPVTPLEKEIVRVVKAMPAWEPGSYKGKKVTVKYLLPLTLN